ncbi:MAG: hypothetical protein K2V38_04270 [Gemmataceae bacterium]|nr:hypothetical protein [Gemmataceae bacterium]
MLPRWAVEQLGLPPQPGTSVTLAGFDGSPRSVAVVEQEATFEGGRFRGLYPVVDQPRGVIGRNLLNYFRLLFDGPAKSWQRVVSG